MDLINRIMEPHKSILGPQINDYGASQLWGCVPFGTPWSNVMENYINIGLYNGPFPEWDGTKFPYPFLINDW